MGESAEQELNRYVQALKSHPDFLQALGTHSEEAVECELNYWLRRSRFKYDEWGLGFPDPIPSGEWVSGTLTWVIESEDKRAKIFDYAFAGYRRNVPSGKLLEITLDAKSKTGSIWLGERDNSASYTWETTREAWASWWTRRVIEEF